MPDVRVLFWNLRYFDQSTMGQGGSGTRLLDTVNPAAGAVCDIFIIVEPNKLNGPFPRVGMVTTRGNSIAALQTCLYVLQSRDPTWHLVPPRLLTCSNNREVHGIFYRNGVVTHVATDNVVVPNAADVPAAAPAVLATLVLAGPVVASYGGGAAAIAVGNAQHYSTVPGAPAPAEVVFNVAGERRPYRTRFQTVVGAHTFDIYSHHAAPTNRLAAAIAGIRNFANVYHVGEHRPHPTLIAGDFNCCTHRACPNGQHPANEHGAQDRLTSADASQYPYWTDLQEILHHLTHFFNDYRTVHATSNRPPYPNQATDLQNQARALGPRLLTALTSARRIQAVAGAAALTGLVTASNQDVVNLNTATAANAMALSNAARLNARALVAFLGANLGVPPLLANLAIAVQQADIAHDHVGNAANQVVAVNAAGAATTAGAAACDAAMHAARHTAARNAGAQATAATALTAGLQALADAARNTLAALVPDQYKTHIVQQLSSLKTPTSIRLGAGVDYLQHAYDHILTNGFVAEQGTGVRDVIGAALAAAPAPAHTNAYRAFYKDWYKGAGAGRPARGLSDHLPCTITVRL